MNGVSKSKTHGFIKPAFELNYSNPKLPWTRVLPLVTRGFDKTITSTKMKKGFGHPCVGAFREYYECMHRVIEEPVASSVFPLTEMEETTISQMKEKPLPPLMKGGSLKYDNPYVKYAVSGRKKANCNQHLQRLTDCSQLYSGDVKADNTKGINVKSLLEPFNLIHYGKLRTEPRSIAETLARKPWAASRAREFHLGQKK